MIEQVATTLSELRAIHAKCIARTHDPLVVALQRLRQGTAASDLASGRVRAAHTRVGRALARAHRRDRNSVRTRRLRYALCWLHAGVYADDVRWPQWIQLGASLLVELDLAGSDVAIVMLAEGADPAVALSVSGLLEG